jgi:predicted DNA-binding ribbon-helix-helix protein
MRVIEYHMAHLRGEAVKKSLVLKRSVIIAGHKTSVSLEGEFWDGLKEIAAERDTPQSMPIANMPIYRQLFRLFVLGVYRDQRR